MTQSRMYASHLEKKLIDEFKQKFQDKLGYSPIVLTKIETGEFSIPLMTLNELLAYFDPFLPYLFGQKLTLNSKSRKREVVELRMMFCYMARSMKYKLETIGEFLGGRDHTTVMHSVTTFLNLLETAEQVRTKFIEVLTHIKENHEPSIMDKPDQEKCQPQPAVLP